MVKIAVTYEKVIFDSRVQACIELSVPVRIAGILVHDRHCYDLDVARADIYRVITGIAHLQGYSGATISTIRYAKKA